MNSTKAQGAIEYLLIIGAAILVVAILIIALVSLTSSIDTPKSKDTFNPLEQQKAEMQNEYFIPTGSTENYTYNGEPITIQELQSKGKNLLICLENDCDLSTTIETGTTIQITAVEGNATISKIALETNTMVPPTTPTQEKIGNCSDFNKNPIPICTLVDLNRIREKMDGNYILINDIDASETQEWNNGEGWKPIGKKYYEPQFSGNLNGNNYAINNLYINRPNESSVGLMGYITSNSIISNLGLKDQNIIGDDYVGGLVGISMGTLTNVYTTGNTKGADVVGGIAGDSWGTITNAYTTGNTIGQTITGGLTGSLRSSIINSYTTGNVNGASIIGGLTGSSYPDGNITNSYTTGNVTGTSNSIGGITGQASGKITNTYSTGNIIGKTSVGGICGESNGIIINSFSISPVNSTQSYSGGLVGKPRLTAVLSGTPNNLTMTNSYYDITLSGQNFCYYNSDVNCIKTNNELEKYYFEIPTTLEWSTDNWNITNYNMPTLNVFEEKFTPININIELFDAQNNNLINVGNNATNIELNYSSNSIPKTQLKTTLTENPAIIIIEEVSTENLLELNLELNIHINNYEDQTITKTSMQDKTKITITLINDPFSNPSLPSYGLSTCNHLSRIREHPDWNYYLTQNIDCASFGNFLPIPSYGSTTKANLFDGKGYSINNLKIVDQPEYSGDLDFSSSLFKTVRTGTIIKNLKLNNIILSTPNAKSNSFFAAPLATTLESGNSNILDITVENITFIANINSSSSAKNTFSGLVNSIGSQNNLKNSIVKGNMNFTLTGKTISTINVDFGGIAQSNSGNIENVTFDSPTTINFNTGSNIGGIVVNSSGNINNATNKTSLSGGDVGGIAVNQTSGTINNSKNYGNLNSGYVAGGLVGSMVPSAALTPNIAYLKNSTNYGTISGLTDSNIGGIAGRMISISFSGGYTGRIYVEGSCNSGTISDSSKSWKNNVTGKIGHTYCDGICTYTDNTANLKDIFVSCSNDCFPVSAKALDADLCDCSTIRIDVSCNQTCVAKPANCTNYACDSVESNGQFCARYGKNCSSFTGLDDCGKTKTVNCGSCYSFQTCNTNVCSNPVGSTSWVGNGSGDAACGKLGKECINAYKETGASAPFCSSILTNGGTAICKSTTIGTGTAWTGNGSPDAACGKIGKETVTFKYWDGTGARVAASSSTTTNGGTTICQNTSIGVGTAWTGNGSPDAACGKIGKETVTFKYWDGTGARVAASSSTTTNGGTTICQNTSIGVGTAWTGNGSPDAACGKIGKETVTFKYWDGTGARVAASSSTTTNGGTTICQNTTLTGTVINWTGNGKADTLCKNIGKKCMFNHIWDGTGKSIFGSTTTTNGGTVICE